MPIRVSGLYGSGRVTVTWQLEKCRWHFWLHLSHKYHNCRSRVGDKVAWGGGRPGISCQYSIMDISCEVYCRSVNECYIALTLNNSCIVCVDHTQTSISWVVLWGTCSLVSEQFVPCNNPVYPSQSHRERVAPLMCFCSSRSSLLCPLNTDWATGNRLCGWFRATWMLMIRKKCHLQTSQIHTLRLTFWPSLAKTG